MNAPDVRLIIGLGIVFVGMMGVGIGLTAWMALRSTGGGRRRRR